MSQKKNEQAYVSETMINTIWNQYEGAIERSRQFRENQDEVYIKALEETTKFNTDLRKSFANFYEENKKVNANVLNSFQSDISKEGESEASRSLIDEGMDVVNRWEKILLTPLNSSFEMMERFEKRAVENNKSYIKNLQKRRKERAADLDEYINLARTAQQRFLYRMEDSLRVFVGSGESK